MKTLGVLLFAAALIVVWPARTARADHHESGAHDHHAALFFGATTFLDPSATHFTVGADYERRLLSFLGAGLLADLVLGDTKELLLAPFVALHVATGLKLVVGVGAALTSDSSHLALRGGLAYDLHLGPVSLAPTLNVDRPGGHFAVVYGVSLGVGF
jgi:hypothetical protein